MDQEKETIQLVESIDLITRKAYHSKLSYTFQKAISEPAQIVGGYLGIQSERQSIFFSVIFSLSIQRVSVDLDDLSTFLGCSILYVVKYLPDIDELVNLKILRRDKQENKRRRRSVPDRLATIRIFVPTDIVDSVLHNETLLPKRTKKNLTKYELLDIFTNILQEKDNELIEYREMCEEVDSLLAENKEVPFILQFRGFKLPINESIILLHVCSQFVNYEKSVSLISLCKAMYNDTESQLAQRRAFINGKTALQKHNLVDLESENFQSDKNICLTEYASDLFFKEDKDLFLGQESKDKDIIPHTSIIQKNLFFNEKERKNLEFLTDLLRQDHYNSVVNRLRDQGMSPGITILFHGYPGTGKTESVYQICKTTERNIKRIEISETKSKWYGQSEKLIKNVFDSYRKSVDTSDITPVLLFDEADGIFSTRKTIGSSSVDQTENATQNILLSEISEFHGILLATTNLTKNLDKAFERRFLYKIFFEKPDTHTKSLIWKDKIPMLSEDEGLLLSGRYDLSGGQIDNVCKKFVLKQILTGNTPDLKEIEEYCQEEFLDKKSERRKIGFTIGG
jgi:AAA+ superfamily predicted ATPase